MGKKQAYSKFSSGGWREFKRRYPKHTESDYCEFANLLFFNSIQTKKVTQKTLDWSWDNCYCDILIEFLWRFRRVNHYFLAPGVAEFCVSSVREFSEDFCKRLPICDSVDAPCTYPRLPFAANLAALGIGPADKVQGGFAVHFPVKERQRSLVVIPDIKIPIPPEFRQSVGGHSAMEYYFAASDGEDGVMAQRHNPPSWAPFSVSGWIARLVFGLSLYMDAFPDAVVEAGSDSVHQVKHYSGTRHIVSRNEIVDEEHQHSVSPHWRRGHFRLLTSSKFIHKQGQTVYVRGTFVKGKAYDVLDDAPPSTSSNGGES